MVGDAGDVDPDRLEEVADRRKLRRQRGGDRLGDAVRLVCRDQLHAPVRAPGPVIGYGQVARTALHDETPKPLEETPDRVHLQAIRRPDARGHAVIGAEDQAGSIDE